MAQQPNVEIADVDKPRRKLEPGPATDWRDDKPGVPFGPDDVPRGGRFGTTGPDPGWALRLMRDAELPDDDPRLASVVTGLVMARAAALGRAAVKDDVAAAVAICGYGDAVPPALVERRKRWLAAVPHEKRPGETAVAEVDRDLLTAKPEQILYASRIHEGA